MSTITGQTPLFQLTLQQFVDILNENRPISPLSLAPSNSKSYIYGLDGLAALLNCSRPTAQKIKDSGKVPFTQVGRKLIFDADAVLTALNKKK